MACVFGRRGGTKTSVQLVSDGDTWIGGALFNLVGLCGRFGKG